jgi:pimeloyl-ACP methyl ester carboxylesterase
MKLHYVRRGAGRPLVLIHGIGGSWRSWRTIIDPLAEVRDVIAIDLPGHGQSPPLPGKPSVATLADAVEDFLVDHGLESADVAGCSIGARLALELARRGRVGAVVALDPDGFLGAHERAFFALTLGLSVRLARSLRPLLSRIAHSPFARAVLLSHLSSQPWRVPPRQALHQLDAYCTTRTLGALLLELAFGPPQLGIARGQARAPITIGWGGRDTLCFPRQALTALSRFPDAELCWFDQAGHFPHWDTPTETVRLILSSTAPRCGASSPGKKSPIPAAS